MYNFANSRKKQIQKNIPRGQPKKNSFRGQPVSNVLLCQYNRFVGIPDCSTSKTEGESKGGTPLAREIPKRLRRSYFVTPKAILDARPAQGHKN